jgi:outer membrane protein
MGARETLRVTEQQVLLDAATAYMNLCATPRSSSSTAATSQRLNLDINRDQARATVVRSWGQLDAAKAQIEATTAQVNSSEIALNGVREEARVGQHTTLDVLNAQQELVNARVALVTA